MLSPDERVPVSGRFKSPYLSFMKKIILSAVLLFVICSGVLPALPRLRRVAEGWANNSVNVPVFRKNSLVTCRDIHFIAFYSPRGQLVLGKRVINSGVWEIRETPYRGNVQDAHNSISIMTDGEGFLHVAWDHHGRPLRYARSVAPFSLELGPEEAMTGKHENHVTYPEFFYLPDGNLVCMYRDGESGRGNLVLNYYDVRTRQWEQRQSGLLDGEGERNAYWQACVDGKGTIHLSWVWRETPDVATNHDIGYACSDDAGISWYTAAKQPYKLPVTAATAEYAWRVPQQRELINQTSMTADRQGHPYIATYWTDENTGIPQYRIVYYDGSRWQQLNTGFRKTPFSLKGTGTKRIPASRPQLLTEDTGTGVRLYLIFRDEERGAGVSVAMCRDLTSCRWETADLTGFSVGSWEPTYDTELWKEKGWLHLFVQPAEQIDGEGRADIPAQPVQVLEISAAGLFEMCSGQSSASAVHTEFPEIKGN